MSEEKTTPEVLPIPAALANEPGVNEVLRVWVTSEGKVYGSWADNLMGGYGGLGGLLGSVAQMIAVTSDQTTAPEVLRVITRDFVAAAARPPAEIPEKFPKLFEYNQIVNAFHDETDRAAGILAAAWLDGFLAQCLRYYFVHDDKESVKLVGSETELEKPLSAFGVRARTLYLLGLISKEALDDLRLIANIRNHFAHRPAKLSFDDDIIKSWCGSLRSTKRKMGSNARENYLFAISWLVVDLNNTLILTHPRDVKAE